MLGDREVVQLLETNKYPARLLNSGIVWIELEVIDPKTNSLSQQRISKSAFADLILDWRSRRDVTDMPEPPSSEVYVVTERSEAKAVHKQVPDLPAA